MSSADKYLNLDLHRCHCLTQCRPEKISHPLIHIPPQTSDQSNQPTGVRRGEGASVRVSQVDTAEPVGLAGICMPCVRMKF